MLNPGSIRAQSMQQFNPRPKSDEKGINPIEIWCHFLGDLSICVKSSAKPTIPISNG